MAKPSLLFSKLKCKSIIKLFTPIRRLGRRLPPFKTSLIRRRRSEAEDYSDPDPIVDTPNSKVSEASPNKVHTPCAPRKSASTRVALQYEDQTEDAVVITCLQSIPFCCHEDLITMDRRQLISVALALNTRLPKALQIPIDHTCSNAFIRKCIEILVGIRKDTFPKSDGCGPEPSNIKAEVGFNVRNLQQVFVTPPSSPLSRRKQLTSRATPRLAQLVEADEDEELLLKVSPKRRRVSSEIDFPFTPTPARRRGVNRSTSLNVDTRSSPLPPITLQRSFSHKLPDEMKNMLIDTSFITTARPRYRRKTDRVPSAGSKLLRIKQNRQPSSASHASVSSTSEVTSQSMISTSRSFGAHQFYQQNGSPGIMSSDSIESSWSDDEDEAMDTSI